MSRWHDPSCLRPQIAVDGDFPRCIECGRKPDPEKLYAIQSTARSIWDPPQDEPIGARDYFWPSSVPWRPEVIDSVNPLAEGTAAMTLATPEEHPEPAFAPPYNERLRSHELRLICLRPAEDKAGPIHLELEAFPDDDCPEYETVSYAWGGEDNDTSRRSPVYIGPYWDMALETRNCQDLLRYLLPVHGIRYVWVDAICIDQSSMAERSSQISKMNAIYRNCLRVILFLGRDLAVQNQGSTRFAPRAELHTLDSTFLFEILSLRYFKRVWVVQELSLAPLVVLPIQGVQYKVDHGQIEMVDLDWKRVDAPWFRHAANPHGVSRMGILDMLQRTSRCQATDPRDKVYGILGMLHQASKDTARGSLSPDYSISSLHAFVGTFAHIVLGLKQVEVLSAAAGAASQPNHPTWLPNMNHREGLAIMSYRSSDRYDRENGLSPDGSDPMCLAAIRTPWHAYRVSLGTKTSCLSVCPVLLFTINSETVTMQNKTSEQKLLKIGDYEFRVSGQNIDVTPAIKPGQTDVFLIGPPMMVLVMNRGPNGTHNLLVGFRCHSIGSSTSTSDKRLYPAYFDRQIQIKRRARSREDFGTITLERITVGEMSGVILLKPVFHSIYDVVSDVKRDLQGLAQRMKTDEWKLGPMGKIFPGNAWTLGDLVPFWMDALVDSRAGFALEGYAPLVNRVDKGFRATCHAPPETDVEVGQTNIGFWMDREDNSRRWTADTMGPDWCFVFRNKNDVCVRIWNEDIRKTLARDQHASLIKYLSDLQTGTGESIQSLAKRDLTDKDRFSNMMPWPGAKTMQPPAQLELRRVMIT